MNQEKGGQEQASLGSSRFGWGAALGLVLAIAGATLLVMVLAMVVLGSGWLPTDEAEAGAPPVLAQQVAPALGPAPTRAAVLLPTPLPDDYFRSADQVSQSGFGTGALLPESPAVPGRTGEGELNALSAASLPAPPADEPASRLVIDAIGVDAPIVPVGLVEMENDGQRYLQWQVPSGYAVGWHATSAAPGSPGNTVLNGHNNVYGAVFRDLIDVAQGDEIVVHEGQQLLRYQVAHREVVEEEDQPLDARLDNAKWMMPTSDERLTIISCWPYIGNTHRVIVVATPLQEGDA